MANLVKLNGDQAEIPSRSLQYSLTPPIAKLQEGLAAWQTLRQDPALQHLPLQQREETVRFLRQFGQLLWLTLFPNGESLHLDPTQPLLLQVGHEWSAYPWEFLNDGRHWLALKQGVVRKFDQLAPGMPDPGPLRSRIRVMGGFAHPLPIGSNSRVARESQKLGTRFISVPAEFSSGEGVDGSAIRYRLVEHATMQALEAGLSQDPDILLFSGFASEEGWHLESTRLTEAPVTWEWILGRVGEAARRGLKLIVLKDSLGYSQPVTAAARTRDLLQAGVPAVIRMEGMQSRRRWKCYLNFLFDHLAKGATVADSHISAVCNAYRATEAGWDWGFPVLYQGDSPGGGRLVRSRSRGNTGKSLAPVDALEDAQEDARENPPRHGRSGGGRGLPSFATLPAPPIFRGKRRIVGREAEQRKLAELLQPDEGIASPLVFLSGPAGSGKTMLALEMARRLRRRFTQVLYLPDRALLPDPFDQISVRGVPRAESHPGQPLFAAVTRHLQAPGAGNGALAGWKEALLHHFGDGLPRLLILDRLEGRPGYDDLLHTLQGLPQNNRVLAVSRARPPVAPGSRIELGAVSSADLERMMGLGVRARMEELDPSGVLPEYCQTDLFAALLLSRSEELPPVEALLGALEREEGRKDPVNGNNPHALITNLLVEAGFGRISKDLGEVLLPLALFPSLVHEELIQSTTGLTEGAVREALAELRCMGWVEAYGTGNYYALHPRLNRAVAERVLTASALARLCPILARYYATLPVREGGAPPGEGDAPRTMAPPLLAWAEERGEHQFIEVVAQFQRMGVERANLAESALLMIAEEDWNGLEQLVPPVARMIDTAENSDLSILLHHCLLAAGEARHHAILQAQALNRLAAPYLRARQAEKARPLLERALELLGESPGWSVLGETYRQLSRCYELLGRTEAAINMLYSAVELAQQLKLPDDLILACQRLVRLWTGRNEQEESGVRYLERQIRFLRQNGHLLQAATIMRLQADYLVRSGSAEEGLDLYRQVLEFCRDAHNAKETGATLLGLADFHLRQGDGARALELLGQAGEECGEGTLDTEARGQILAGICQLFEQRNQPKLALQGYLRIRSLLEEIGDREALIGVLDRIGGIYYQLGEQEKSTQCYEERLHLQAALIPS